VADKMMIKKYRQINENGLAVEAQGRYAGEI